MKLCLLLVCIWALLALSVNGQDNKTPEAIKYMMKYGYLADFGPNTEALYSKDGIKKAIKRMQSYGGLVPTGVLDNATLALFTKPRCGVKDVEPESNIENKRKKRYAIASEGWKKKYISYRIGNLPNRIPRHVVMRQFFQAFKVWSDISPLKFQQSNSHEIDIDIIFKGRQHGDSYPFDGQGNVLAHAFFPHLTSSISGDVHFDIDEKWLDMSDETHRSDIDGVDLYTVAAHEIGHALGLAHSNDTEALMFPYYKGYTDPKNIIGRDDILAMHELYVNRRGNNEQTTRQATRRPTRKTTRRPTTKNARRTPPRRPTTRNPRRTTPRRTTLVESRRRFTTRPTRRPITRLTTPRRPQAPRVTRPTRRPVIKIDNMELPTLCDGSYDAMSVIRGELMIFKKKFMWRYRSKGVLTPGYPVEFKRFFYKFPEVISKIDALYERADGKIVFFTGPEYWVYDGVNFVENSPQPLSKIGLPLHIQKIDAALFKADEKVTYLFTSDRYFRYDEVSHCVEPRTPVVITRESGLPTNIDNALEWKDGKSYLFKDKHFWVLKNDAMEVSDQYFGKSPEVWGGYDQC